MHSFLIEMVFKILTYSTGNGRENDFLLKYLPISAFISKSSFETISKRVKCKARSKKILDQIRKKQVRSWSTKWLKLSSKLELDINKQQKIDGHNLLLKKNYWMGWGGGGGVGVKCGGGGD